MNRRNFLQLAALAIAGKAAERVFPFRVYSIPKKIVLASKWDQFLMEPTPYTLYGIPGMLPHGYFDHLGPWMGIDRSQYIPFTNLKKTNDTSATAIITHYRDVVQLG